MNTYNSEKFIRESIKSVLAQSYRNWELIVFDNASNDHTKKIVDEFEDNRIRYIFTPNHTHLGEARFKAEKYLDGEFLGILDSDDIWMPNKLEIQIPYLRKDKKIAVVYSNTFFFNEKFKKKLYSFHQPSGFIFNEILFKYKISLESILIKRDCVSKLEKFFCPQFQLISDFDLIARLSFYHKIVYVPFILSKWRIHNNNSTKGRLINFIDEKLDWLKINKNLLTFKQKIKLEKFYKINKSLLLICENRFYEANQNFKNNFSFSLKYFLVLYILKIKIFNNFIISKYKKRISFNDLV